MYEEVKEHKDLIKRIKEFRNDYIVVIMLLGIFLFGVVFLGRIFYNVYKENEAEDNKYNTAIEENDYKTWWEMSDMSDKDDYDDQYITDIDLRMTYGYAKYCYDNEEYYEAIPILYKLSDIDYADASIILDEFYKEKVKYND